MRDSDPRRRRFAWASLFASVYFGAHQLVDLYVGLPCVLFAFALSIAYLDATASRSLLRTVLPFGCRRVDAADDMGVPPTDGMSSTNRASARPGPRGQPRSLRLGALAIGGLAVGIVAATAFLAWSESHALQGEDAVGYANAGNWSAALASASAAQSGDPQLPAYDFLAGVAALHTGDQHLAATLLAKSAAADDFPEAWLDLASARLALGDRTGRRLR
jgi:hypothetical protein